MAVDANVLIYERIREEKRNGRSPVSSVEAGYDQALSTIIDANLTTLLAALVMFWLGAGPVRGFAVTLSVGIFTSVFTAVVVSRLILAVWLRYTRPKWIPI
jgi:preprotein translocase subunit SecD